MELTPYVIAQRFIGLAEGEGAVNNPAIVGMLQLDAAWAEHDSTPWCSALCNFSAWLARYERSKSLRARSWLRVGELIEYPFAVPGDVVILKRGSGLQPGPDVIEAPGHVGFLDRPIGPDDTTVMVLGGNQRNRVSVAGYRRDRLLGIRRLGVEKE